MNPFKRMRLQLAEKLWDADGNFKEQYVPAVLVILFLAMAIVGGHADHVYLSNI